MPLQVVATALVRPKIIRLCPYDTVPLNVTGQRGGGAYPHLCPRGPARPGTDALRIRLQRGSAQRGGDAASTPRYRFNPESIQ